MRALFIAGRVSGSIDHLPHWFVTSAEDRMTKFGYKLMTEEHGPAALT